VPALAGTAGTGSAAARSGAGAETLTNYDARSDIAIKKVLSARAAALAAHPSAGVKTLRSSLGRQAVIDLDPLTGTPRNVARVDGFLTGKSSSSANSIVLTYLRGHEDVFKLGPSALGSLSLRKDYVDILGTHHLSYVQTVRGVPVFGNGIKAHVSKDGQLIAVQGSPVASLSSSLSSPALSATQAHDAAMKDVFSGRKVSVSRAGTGATRDTDFVGGDYAQLVIFQTVAGPRLGWEVISLREGFVHVIDGQSGRTLYRMNTTAKDNNGLAWTNYPGAPIGGTQVSVDMTGKGWLSKSATELNGTNAHVYLDLNDDDIMNNPVEKVGPSSKNSFAYPFTDFSSTVGGSCSASYQCSWDPSTPFSWQTNAKQDAVQMFFFVNTFHDHLKAAPIGFTPAAGNFEGGDRVQGNALDGANTNNGLPDSAHVDNANMNTPPDGFSPRMQMYLFPDPSDPTDPFIASNSGDEADIVYHEYTHGLSNRLVVDALGNSTLGNIQAGSMGEAWSDWYAYDYLVGQGLVTDTSAAGEVRVGEYVGAGQDLIRTQPLDCPATNQPIAKCAGTPGAGAGGYTYGDFGRIIGRPEVHADGEIWGETLWDLRASVGQNVAESIVTRAMELSPANPSYLDMRNSILQADMVAFGGSHKNQIWTVFANRGMGFFAGSVDGDDSHPVENFSMPPSASSSTGTVTGRVTDSSGAPVAGAIVAFGGHNSGFAGDYGATTAADGSYTIGNVFTGTYPTVFAHKLGYDPQVRTLAVGPGTNTVNWSMRKDWAATANGTTVTSFNGVDYSQFGCGPAAMLDTSQGSGWSTDATETSPDHTSGLAIEPRFMVIKLPQALTIAEIDINPANNCGDPGSSSTGDYSVETSTNGTTWTTVSSGHFGIGDRFYHAVTLSGGNLTGVLYVRYTMISTQVVDLGGNCPGNFGGCDFVDSVELGVYTA
jgi:hypothetical protein